MSQIGGIAEYKCCGECRAIRTPPDFKAPQINYSHTSIISTAALKYYLSTASR